jgi:hypothetical protein
MATEAELRTRSEVSRRLPAEGAVGGLIAGAVFAVASMVVVAAQGGPLLAPWRMFASVLLGEGALAGPMTLGIFVVGFIVHFALSAVFGAIWGVVAAAVSPGVRDSYGSHSAAGGIYGLVLYLVNFQILARLLFPQFLATGAVAQILLHILAFGVPLGLYLTSRLRPVELHFGAVEQRGRP